MTLTLLFKFDISCSTKRCRIAVKYLLITIRCVIFRPFSLIHECRVPFAVTRNCGSLLDPSFLHSGSRRTRNRWTQRNIRETQQSQRLHWNAAKLMRRRGEGGVRLKETQVRVKSGETPGTWEGAGKTLTTRGTRGQLGTVETNQDNHKREGEVTQHDTWGRTLQNKTGNKEWNGAHPCHDFASGTFLNDFRRMCFKAWTLGRGPIVGGLCFLAPLLQNMVCGVRGRS